MSEKEYAPEGIRITKEMLKTCYQNGIVCITDSPDLDGCVCSIGNDWFYFGGQTAEEENAESYIKNVPQEDIINEIYDALSEMRNDWDLYDAEYTYYFYTMQEQMEELNNKEAKEPEL